MSRVKSWMSKIQTVGDRLYRPFTKIKNLPLRAVVVSVCLSSVIWFAAALIIRLAPFGDESLCTNDGYAQYMPFLAEFWSVFREGGSVLYSWHGALGSNFYLTMAYYLFSPFSFLVLLFDKAQIPSAANLIIILKNILVIAIMAWYLATRNDRKNGIALAVACAMAYGFGYYFLGYAVNFMWMDSIALTPLMLYGLERINTRKGRWFYLLSLAGAILMNFYMGAILCIFLFLYFVVIEWRWNREGWKAVGWFAACSISAALCAGIVLFPVIYGMLMANASRMSPPDFEVFNDWKYFFSRLLPDAGVVRITHNRGTINLYMGTAVIYGCLLYLFSPQPSRRTKYGMLFLCLLYLCATQISWLNYAFHGFYLQRQVPNRFAFLVVLLATIMMESGFRSIKKLKFWKIMTAGIISAVYFGVIAALTDSDQLWLAFLLPAVCVLYLLAAMFKRRKIISLLVAVESVVGLTMVAPGSLDDSFTNMSAYIEAARMTPGGRAEIECSDIANAPTLYGMNGVSAFNSVINPKTASLLGKLGFASGENYYRFFGYNPLSALFFNIRSITTKKNAVLPYPYVQTVEVQNMEVWTSPYEIPIGLCLEDPDVILSSSNKFDNNNELFPGAFIDYELTAKGSGDSTFKNEDGVYKFMDVKADDLNVLTLDPVEADNFYLYAKVDGTKKFTVTYNGKIMADNKYEGNMVYIGDVLPQDKIQISFKAESDKEEATVRLQGAILPNAHIEAAAEYLIDNGLKDEKIDKNVITGTYHTDHERTMIFTVPFDEGWQAQVNGKRVETSAWQDALVSIQVPEGDSEIKLVYIPAGLNQGIFASTLGLISAAVILIGPYVMDRKKRKAAQADQFESKDENSGVPGYQVYFGEDARPSTVVDLSEIRQDMPAQSEDEQLQTIFDEPQEDLEPSEESGNPEASETPKDLKDQSSADQSEESEKTEEPENPEKSETLEEPKGVEEKSNSDQSEEVTSPEDKSNDEKPQEESMENEVAPDPSDLSVSEESADDPASLEPSVDNQSAFEGSEEPVDDQPAVGESKTEKTEGTEKTDVEKSDEEESAADLSDPAKEKPASAKEKPADNCVEAAFDDKSLQDSESPDRIELVEFMEKTNSVSDPVQSETESPVLETKSSEIHEADAESSEPQNEPAEQSEDENQSHNG